MNCSKFTAITITAIICCFKTNSTIAQSPVLSDQSSALVVSAGKKSEDASLVVRKCNDFQLTGKGNNTEWNKTGWTSLTKLDKSGEDYKSQFKILYSLTGIYVLFQSEDKKITTKDYKDFENIFNGDVVEVFFHPAPNVIEYFEYEVNQLDKELILTISNLNGQNWVSWIPWHHDGKNGSGIKKMVNVIGGEKELNGKIQSWSAEIFFPYGALGLLPHVPPASGSLWNANFCRLDYDSGTMVKWSWSPTIEKSFHELNKFLSIKFE